MNWSFKINKNLRTGLEIEFTPEQELLSVFFHSLKIENIPTILSHVVKSTGYGQEFIGLLFYKEMDWEDKEGLQIEEGEVSIYHQEFGETVLKESLLDKILFDYCYKLLEIYRGVEILSPTWEEEMEEGLRKLKLKIESQS